MLPERLAFNRRQIQHRKNFSDPVLLNKMFSSSNVSGNNITVANHYSQQGSLVTFSSPDTLPSPLVAGCQYYWQRSTTNPSNTASYSIASGVVTVRLASGCNLAPGTPVFLRNIHCTSTAGVNACDGYYTLATGSGTSFHRDPLRQAVPTG